MRIFIAFEEFALNVRKSYIFFVEDITYKRIYVFIYFTLMTLNKYFVNVTNINCIFMSKQIRQVYIFVLFDEIFLTY